MKKLFVLLSLTHFPWQPELMQFSYALRTVKKVGREPIRSFKNCYPSIPPIAREHTLFSARIEDYFDFQEGVLRLDKMSMQKLDDKCTLIPSSQLSQLIVKIQSYLSKNQILFIGENHLDYFSLNSPAGIEVVKFITQYLPENTVLFTESERGKSKLEEKDFTVVALDGRGHDIQFCRAIMLLHYIIKIDSLNDKDADHIFMKKHFASLFLHYNDASVWPKFCKSSNLEPSETKLCKRIIKVIKKAKKLASSAELDKLVGDKLFSLFQKNKTDTFFLFYKFIQDTIPKLKKFDDKVKEKERIAMLEESQTEISVLLEKLNLEDGESLTESDWETFNRKISEFIVQYRNVLWVEKINREVNQYQKKHNLSSPPNVVTIIGHNHIAHLKSVLLKEQQQHQMHPDL